MAAKLLGGVALSVAVGLSSLLLPAGEKSNLDREGAKLPGVAGIPSHIPTTLMTATELEAQQPEGTAASALAPDRGAVPSGGGSWSYRHCAAARAAGAAPLYAGQPGYGGHLDRDGDGIACEPYRGQR